jgi:hypothetical protein
MPPGYGPNYRPPDWDKWDGTDYLCIIFFVLLFSAIITFIILSESNENDTRINTTIEIYTNNPTK